MFTRKTTTGILTLVIFAGLFVPFLCRYLINVPIVDDYDFVRATYFLETQPMSFFKKIDFLLETQNDHRMLIGRIVAYLDYAIEGSLNYKTLAVLGLFCLLGILVYWRQTLGRMGADKWLILPLVFIYLSAISHDHYFWGINALQHPLLNLLVFASLFLLGFKKSNGYFTLSIILALAAMITFGNGFLVFPAGFFMLLFLHNKQKLAIWSVVSIVAIGFNFLYDYELGQATHLDKTPGFILNVIISFIAFAGAWTEPFRAPGTWALPFAAGCATLAINCYGLFRALRQKKEYAPFLGGIFAFTTMTMGIIALSRGGQDIENVFPGRYTLYQQHLLALVFLYIVAWSLNQSWKTKVLPVATVLAIGFNLVALVHYFPLIEQRNRILMADSYNWKKNRKLLTNFRSELADFFTLPAYEMGIYTMDAFPLKTWELSAAYPASLKTKDLDLELTAEKEERDYFGHPQTIVKFELRNSDATQPELTTFLTFHSDSLGKSYVLPALVSASGKRDLLTKGKLLRDGFFVKSFSENFKPGTYEIGILKEVKPAVAESFITPYEVYVDSTNVILKRVR